MKLTRTCRGFTLIELLFVMVVIALFARVALPKVSAIMRSNLRSGATRVASYLQAAHEQAVMRNQHMRIRFDFNSHKYWAELYGDDTTIPLLDADTNIEEALRVFRELEEVPSLSEEEQLQQEHDKFKKISDGSLKPNKLPQGIRFAGIYIAREGRRITDQTATIEFFPNGFSTEVIVYIQNEYDEFFSIIMPPIKGRPKVEKGEAVPGNV